MENRNSLIGAAVRESEITKIEQEPLVSYRVNDRPPTLGREQLVGISELAIGSAPAVDLNDVNLVIHRHWLSHYVAALVKAAARVVGHFAPSTGNLHSRPEDREMLLGLEGALLPFLREGPKCEPVRSQTESIERSIMKKAKPVTVQEVMALLNETLKLDREAIGFLVEHRVPCNNDLADHPTIEVGCTENGDPLVAMLGIINGLFGIDEDAHGPIIADIAGAPMGPVRFSLNPNFDNEIASATRLEAHSINRPAGT